MARAALQATLLVVALQQSLKSPIRRNYQAELTLKRERGHIPLRERGASLHVRTFLVQFAPGHGQHVGGDVQPCYILLRSRHSKQHSAGSTAEFQHRPIALLRQAGIEVNVPICPYPGSLIIVDLSDPRVFTSSKIRSHPVSPFVLCR